MILLGGDRAWKQRKFRDVVVSFHWVNGEPAMCLWPVQPRTLHKHACIICLSAIHKYAKSNGDPEAHYIIPKAMQFAREMGFVGTKQEVKNIADAILESIPDLVKMPPEPTKKQLREDRPVGSMAVIADGKTVHEAEVFAPNAEEMAGKKHSYGD